MELSGESVMSWGVSDVMVRISPMPHLFILKHYFMEEKPRAPGLHSSFKTGLVSQLGLRVFVVVY